MGNVFAHLRGNNMTNELCPICGEMAAQHKEQRTMYCYNKNN